MHKLGKSLQSYYLQGLAKSTQRTYTSAKSRFIAFCTQACTSPLPLSESVLCFYVSHLADEGLAHTTIKSYLSACRHLHISHGYSEPCIGDMPRLAQVMKGIKASQAKQGRQAKPRLPITPSILTQIKSFLNKKPEDFDNIMAWAAYTTCFFGFLRAGEICIPSDSEYDSGAHLSFSDIAVDSPTNPTIMQVRIKSSKTDPFRKGVDIYLGRTHNSLCPITAMMAYLSVRRDTAGPLFHFKDGRPLTRDRFVNKLRDTLRNIGICQGSYSGHSFRAGAATTAAQHGIPDATIQLLGRWQSTAYLVYIKTPRDKLASITATLSTSLK